MKKKRKFLVLLPSTLFIYSKDGNFWDSAMHVNTALHSLGVECTQKRREMRKCLKGLRHTFQEFKNV